ncbi:MAG: MFS transporter [Eubacteriales bacterium]|nr:MFS transporter [Eubacteriales bacterium]
MKNRQKTYLASLYLFYTVYYMIMACSSYQSVYLKDIGMSNTQIGTIMSVAPLIAMFFQPLWGMLGDRMPQKRWLLTGLLLGFGVVALLLRTTVNFGLLIVLFTLMNIVQSPCTPIMDTVTLEYVQEHNHAFGPIRMMGSVGYVAMAWLSGIYMNNDVSKVFYILAGLAGVLAALTLLMPPVKGHQTKANKVPLKVLFQNKELVLLFVMVFCASVTTTYGHTFFGKYFSQLGASTSMLGAMLFVGSFLEIPFLLFADKLMPKLSIWAWVLLGFAITALRWVLIGVTTNLYALMALQMPNLFATICFTYGPVLYVNKKAPQQLRATAQSILVFAGFGLSRVVGSLLGGYFSDLWSIPTVFIANGVFLAVCLAGFAFYIVRAKGWRAITTPGDL